MEIVRSIADYFRSSSSDKKVDRYGILSPLLATGEFVTATTSMYSMFKNSVYAEMMSGRTKPINKHAEHAADAYRAYVRHLPGHEQALEKAQPFSTILLALESISGNISLIEDNFQSLFGSFSSDKPETAMRSSSLVVIGYLEKVDNFTTWLSSLVQHMTADSGDMIPPFRIKELISKATVSSEFAELNLNKWNYKRDGLLGEIKEMQRKGSDLSVQSDNGVWIDQFAHDSQFSPVEQNLMTASLRSTFLMYLTWDHVKVQDKIDLLSSRKDWLTSKIIFEEAKLRGMDPSLPDYKRMQNAVNKYSDMVSKYEQKIERLRG